MARLRTLALLASLGNAACWGYGGWGAPAKKKHEWTYEEFIDHKENNKGPHHATGWHQAIAQHADKIAEHKAEKNGEDPAVENSSGEHGHAWHHGHHEMLKAYGFGKPELSDEHHEFRAKSDEDKKAHYEDWIAEHTAAHEQAEYEKTFRYKVYYFFSQFGWLLLAVKVTLLLSFCWYLRRKAAKSRLASDLCAGFSRGTARPRRKAD